MTLPPHADVRGGIRRWGGLGNFQDGDCVIAGFEHNRMTKAVANGSSFARLIYRLGFRPPHTPYTLAIYAQYLATQGEKPGPSAGVDPASFFPWAQERGLIIAWGRVNLTGGDADRDALHQAMIDYRGVVLTILLTENAYQNWYTRTPWHIGPDPADRPNPQLAHAVLLVQYNDIEDAVVTWGRAKTETATFTSAATYGAFVFLDESDVVRPEYPELLSKIKSL